MSTTVAPSGLTAGFTGLRLHTAPGVLGQQPGLDPLVAESLRSAGTVEIVRPFHGVAVQRYGRRSRRGVQR